MSATVVTYQEFKMAQMTKLIRRIWKEAAEKSDIELVELAPGEYLVVEDDGKGAA